MGRIVYLQLKALSVTAATAQDVWSVVASSTVPIRLLGFELTSSAVGASIIDCNLHRITASGSGGSAGSPELANETDATVTSTARTLDTTAGTDGGGLMGYQWEQLGPINHLFGDRAPRSKVSEGFAFTWNTATAATISGWVCWEEL